MNRFHAPIFHPEEQLRIDLDAAKALTKAGTDPQAAFGHISSAARTASRVVAVTKGEVENTADPVFQKELESATGSITNGTYHCVFLY